MKPEFSPKTSKFPKVETTINEPLLMKLIVEELAAKNLKEGMAGISFDDNLIALDSSTHETFVTGNIDFEYSNMKICLPFLTGFLFSCTKSKRSFFEMHWVISLS
ncbi:MAG: hypothetical protein ABIW38_02725 [Ferruginibacter sp.]